MSPDAIKQPQNSWALLSGKNFLEFMSASSQGVIEPNLAQERAVADSDGFSFAQLREAYILAAQYAYERDQDVTPEDLCGAVHTLRWGFTADVSKHSVGFGINNIRQTAALPIHPP